MAELAQACEFVLSDCTWRRIAELAKQRAGIDFHAGKRSLVHNRLTRRLQALRLDAFEPYLALIEDPQAEEASWFLHALTTHVTDFFRVPQHFELLSSRVLPRLWQRHAHDRRLRIWSAGCASGEEPYSLAMTVLEALPDDGPWDIKILASDIDAHVLPRARAGTYEINRLERVSRARLERFFDCGRGALASRATVKPELQALVEFQRLNLIDAWPLCEPFDVIFCRNVLIYFDLPTRQRLVQRYADALLDGGHLCLGHAESPAVSGTPWVPCGAATAAYRKLPGLRVGA